MVKNLTLLIGSGLPAWAGWDLGAEQGIMTGYWMGVVGFALGWYLSRRFASEFLE